MQMGEKIQRCRIQGHLSRRGLGKAAKISHQSLIDIEADDRANPGVYRIRAIADVLGVSMDWLTDDTADWPPPSPEVQLMEFVKDAFDRSGLSGGPADVDEQELLAVYRGLPPDRRPEVQSFVRGLLVGVGRADLTAEQRAEGERLYRMLVEGARKAQAVHDAKKADETGKNAG